MQSTPLPPDSGRDPPASGPTVLVADDHGLLRQGMRLLLGSVLPGCRVIEADTLDATLAALRASAVDLLLLDLDMPGMTGAAILHTLRSLYPDLKIAVVTGSANRQMILDCLAAGINGYVLKQEPVEEVAYAITTMHAGRIYVTPVLTHMIEDVPVPSAVPQPANFTSRQLEVLRLLAQGRSNKEIARALELSEGTVKIHLAAIFRLLGARNRTEAVVIAGRLQL